MNNAETLHALFEEQARHRSEHVAIVCNKQSITWNELNTKANKLAHYLRESGVGLENHVAFCMERSIDLLVTMLAILKAGGAYVPLEASQPRERLFYLLQDNQFPLLILTSDYLPAFSGYQGKILVLDKSWKHINKKSGDNPVSLAQAENLAYVIYTSGSTGTPKGVLIEHRSIINYARWFMDYSQYKPQQRIDFSSNYIFDMAVTSSIVALMSGLNIVIASDEIKKHTGSYLNYLHDYKISLIKITPGYFKALIQEASARFVALPHLQTIILGGENLAAADCKAWLALYPEHILINEYGPTETSVAVSAFPVNRENIGSIAMNVPIGKPCPGVYWYIVDENMQPVNEGETGELLIGGICLARGYLNQPQLTEQQFINDTINKSAQKKVYKTGDLCRCLPDGSTEYIARADAQVKIRGYRVEPGEIINCLNAHPDISAALVTTQTDLHHENRLIAYFIPKADKIPAAKGLRRYLTKHLPEFMIPAAFVSVDSFPLTANGKIDYKALPEPRISTDQPYRAPRNELEQILATIWAEEIDIKPPGIYDDFFELGGHSLAAARIISRINNLIGKNIRLYDLYSNPDIASLADVISRTDLSVNALHQPDDNPPVIPLSDFQLMLWLSDLYQPKAKKLNMIAKKRFQGCLDINALNFAFACLIKKHRLLSYQIHTFRPLQSVQNTLPFSVVSENISHLSAAEKENVLNNAMKQLSGYYPWKKNTANIMAKLYCLDEETSELQICLPHIISDEQSTEIIFDELSRFYLLYTVKPASELCVVDEHFKDYVIREKHYFKQHLDRDLLFWEKYLQDTDLFSFPSTHILRNQASQANSWSTWVKIPEQAVTNLQLFCARHHISVMDGLCAILSLALQQSDPSRNKRDPILINIIKSTRDNKEYDEAIGCFLRADTLKINLDNDDGLVSLAKKIHQSFIDTTLWQNCSNLVKFSCIGAFKKKNNPVKNHLINFCSNLYSKLTHTPAYLRKILMLSARLSSFKNNDRFVINLNVSSSFINNENQKKDENLFGFKIKTPPNYPYNMLNINSIFEACFLRADDKNTPCLVISANLKPAFREQIAADMIRIMSTDTVDEEQTVKNKAFLQAQATSIE